MSRGSKAHTKKKRTSHKSDQVLRMLDGLGDELKPLLDQLLIEAQQGMPTLLTATRINELMISRGIVPREAIVPKVPKLPEQRQAQIRYAVREAEQMIETQWWQAGIARTDTPLDEKCRMLNEALVAARKAAREELLARWAKEDAAAEAPLSPHITKLSSNDVPRERIDAEAIDVEQDLRVISYDNKKLGT
jgi:hypothetical protein